jgi:hypothetical protein
VRVPAAQFSDPSTRGVQCFYRLRNAGLKLSQLKVRARVRLTYAFSGLIRLVPAEELVEESHPIGP